MSEDITHNPHDKLFKEAFARREMAKDFFDSYLPDDITSRMDWDTLKLQSGKFTSEALQGSESDLLYTIEIDQHPAMLYCLFEHQSKPDPWMPLRLLRYIIGIWEQYRKQNPNANKLPPILPIVLYQGGDNWTADTSLSSLIETPEGLSDNQPDFRHLLIDLNQFESDKLQGSPSLKTILLALKSSREHTQYEFELLVRLLAKVLNVDSALIRTVMLYLYSVDNQTDISEYINQAEALELPQLQEEFMTIADKLRNEGMQQGMQQALRDDIVEILEVRFHSVSFSVKKQLEDITDAGDLRRILRLAVKVACIQELEESISS